MKRPNGLISFAAREALAYALHGVLVPFAPPGPRPNGAAGPTLVFIHGHGGGPGAFAFLRRALAARGFRRSVSFGYWSWGSMPRVAEQLADFVAREIPAGPIVVVGHSLGGLVARTWLQDLGGRSRAVALVTLSTPHQGLVAVPGAGLIPLVREALPGSPLINRLADGAHRLDDLPSLSAIRN